MKLLPTKKHLSLALAVLFPFVAVAGDYTGKAPISAKATFEKEEHPDENLWIYTKGTAAREKGEWEFKLRDTARIGKKFGSYQFHDIRPEVEYGLSDNWTIGASMWIFHHDYRGIPWGPMNERGPRAATQGLGDYTGTQLGGWEFFTKYEFLDPFEDNFGLALGLAYDVRSAYRLDGGQINQKTLTPQLFLQKSLMDDRLQIAFTGKLELEQRKGGNILEEEIAPDLALGVSYNVKKDLWVGIETRWQSDFLVPYENGVGYDPAYPNLAAKGIGASPSNWDLGEFALGDQFQHGLYLGPTVHWNPSEKPWWLTAGALWQVNGWSAEGPGAATNNKDWDEHERLHIGVIWGYEWGGSEGGEYSWK